MHAYIHSILSNQYSNELPCIEVYIHSYVHTYCVVQHSRSMLMNMTTCYNRRLVNAAAMAISGLLLSLSSSFEC